MLNEINWPQDYLPGTTDNFASNEIIVAGITAAGTPSLKTQIFRLVPQPLPPRPAG